LPPGSAAKALRKKSLCVKRFEEAVEMGTVENVVEFCEMHLHFQPSFTGFASHFASNSPASQCCGKAVKTVWTAHAFFGHFSLAPDASIRQNPARAVDPVAVEETI
jgi:hypothetical protein